jgi:hypothetical protein
MADNKKRPQAKTFVIGGTDLVARVVSVFSFVLAFLAFYYTTLAPADMTVGFVHPEFQMWTADNPGTFPLPGGLSATRERSSFALIANCSFANNGAQIGSISSLAIQLVSDDGTTLLFSAYETLDDAPKITVPDGHLRYDISKSQNFSPILLPGKQTAHHTLLFMLESPSDLVLTPRKYHVNMWAWYGLSREPHKQQISTLDFSDSVVAVLRTGVLAAFPFDEERDQIHQLTAETGK